MTFLVKSFLMRLQLDWVEKDFYLQHHQIIVIFLISVELIVFWSFVNGKGGLVVVAVVNCLQSNS